jgi:hypothetical protein
MTAETYRLGPDTIVLLDSRFCTGCHRNPWHCAFAFYSRVPSKEDPLAIGSKLSDWRRGDGCPLEIVTQPGVKKVAS